MRGGKVVDIALVTANPLRLGWIDAEYLCTN